jgi:parvulin-like peptidyl-prolyl isomerase
VIGSTVAAAGCSYVNPPALAISESSDTAPYFRLSATELRTMVDDAQKSATRTQDPTSYTTASYADALNKEVQTNVLKHELAHRGIVATDADKASATQQLQSSSQSQTAPTDAELAYATDAVALSRVLADDAIATGNFNLDEMAHRLYDNAIQNGGLVTPAQLCLHIIEIDPKPATEGAQPTAEETAAAETKAKAIKARLDAGEDFETIAATDPDSAFAGNPNAPEKGDLGCRDTSGSGQAVLPPAIVTPLENVAVGAITEPLSLQGVFVIARVDKRVAEKTTPYEEVKEQAETLAKQQLGSRFVTDRLTQIYADTVITIDPQFGRWDTEKLQVTTPEGAATPTTPTTTTPPFDPSSLLGGAPSEPTSTEPPASTASTTSSSTTTGGSAPSSTTTAVGGESGTTTTSAGATGSSTTTSTIASSSTTASTTSTTAVAP